MDFSGRSAKITALALILGIALSGCAAQKVPGAYPTPNAAVSMAGAGAAVGATVGARTHPSVIPVGAAIGGIVGGTVGLLSDSSKGILRRLTQQGVEVIAVGESLRLVIYTDNCFEFGTSAFTPHCEAILSNTAALLKKTGNAPIKVQGYSDNNFGEALALRLSQEQADSVVAFLWTHGIPRDRFYAKGYGSADPIATNYTARGNSLNRRIEISLN